MDIFDQLKTDAIVDAIKSTTPSPIPLTDSETSNSPIVHINISPIKDNPIATINIINKNVEHHLKRCCVRINRNELQRNLALLNIEKLKRKSQSPNKKVKPLTKAQKKHFNSTELMPSSSTIKLQTNAAKKLTNIANKNVKELRVRVKRLNDAEVKHKDSKKQNKRHSKSSRKSSSSNKQIKGNISSPSKAHFFIKLQDTLAKNVEKMKEAIEKKRFKKDKKSKKTKNNNNHNKKLYGGVKKTSFKAKNKVSNKLKRFELEKKFGKHCFRSFVKIKRCKHPLMLIFESNEEARRLKALEKKNKRGKNLTVSFKENVEIFGATSSDTSDNDELINLIRPKKKEILTRKIDDDAILIDSDDDDTAVTPARLKKVENGKIIDDIELEIFKKSNNNNAAIKEHLNKNKKRAYFVPLKDCYASNSKKERFKQANEKLPTKGFHNLNTEDEDDDDDDDDDCEYIVPNDVPARRSSNSSILNTSDDIKETTTRKSNNDNLLHLNEKLEEKETVLEEENNDNRIMDNEIIDKMERRALTPLSPPPTNVAEIESLSTINRKTTENNQKLLAPSNGISDVVALIIAKNELNEEMNSNQLVDDEKIEVQQQQQQPIESFTPAETDVEENIQKKDEQSSDDVAKTSVLTAEITINNKNTLNVNCGENTSLSPDDKIETKSTTISTNANDTTNNNPPIADKCFAG